MATLVSFHAHPDDESISAAGIVRRAADQGHRVVLVFGTRGEMGEVQDGFLADGEPLWQRRVAETLASAEILGAARVEFLPYIDSGMMGEPSNEDPACFWQAPVEDAARQLADLLVQESADVLTVYDDNGGYGHPDHIQVHRVGMRATEIAGVQNVYESVINRDQMREMMMSNPEWNNDDSPIDFESFGTPEAEITTRVDVAAAIAAKRAAMQVHETQIGDFGPVLKMADEELRAAFGTEWFRRVGSQPGGSKELSLPL